MDWLDQNKTWVFSGIGVAVILGVVGVGRRLLARSPRPPVPVDTAAQNATKPVHVTVPKTTQARLHSWFTTTERIRRGDFYSVKTDVYSIRVELVDIRPSPIPNSFESGVTEETAAELYIEYGGALVHGGRQTPQLGVNRYLVPRSGNEHCPRSVYAFHLSERLCSFLAISVTHINPSDQWIDVRVVFSSIWTK